MAKADFLKERGNGFLENAEHNIQKENFNLAAFNLEQSCQIYLKYYLFKKLTDFPKTYFITELLTNMGTAYQN